MAHLSFCSSLDDTMAGYPHCDCGENPPPPAEWEGCKYIVALGKLCPKCGHHHMTPVAYHERMPKTTREKQEDFRARQAMLGLKEVRGVYLPEALHAPLKEYAQKLLEQHQKEHQRG